MASGHPHSDPSQSGQSNLREWAPVAEPRRLQNGDIIEVADGVALRVELSGGGDKDVTQFRGRDTRRMYAIMSADVVGYTRLVEQDDIATARQLETCVKIVRDRVEQMDGRIFQISATGSSRCSTARAPRCGRLSSGKPTLRA